MRIIIYVVLIMLIALVTLTCIISYPFSKIDKAEDEAFNNLFNKTSITETIFLVNKIESIGVREKYNKEDMLSMEEKISVIYKNERNIFNEFLSEEFVLEHNGLYLSFSELAALFDVTIKSIRQMTLIIIIVDNIYVVRNAENEFLIDILVCVDINGLINKINSNYQEETKILFNVKIQTYIDSYGKMRYSNIDIEALNATIDYKLLEYGFLYLYDTPDYCGVVANIAINIFNGLGRPNVRECGVYFETTNFMITIN